MIEDQYLHLFITEELFNVKEGDTIEKPVPETEGHISIAVLTNPLSDIQLALLQKILSSVNIDINSIEIIYSEEDLVFSFDKLLIFGTNISSTFENYPLFKVESYGKGEILISKAINELEASKEDKMRLWQALKSWFKI